MQSSLEEFRMIEGYEHYQISNLGRVYSLKTKKDSSKQKRWQTDGKKFYYISMVMHAAAGYIS